MTLLAPERQPPGQAADHAPGGQGRPAGCPDRRIASAAAVGQEEGLWMALLWG
jgi:hypothetical protein